MYIYRSIFRCFFAPQPWGERLPTDGTSDGGGVGEGGGGDSGEGGEEWAVGGERSGVRAALGRLFAPREDVDDDWDDFDVGDWD